MAEDRPECASAPETSEAAADPEAVAEQSTIQAEAPVGPPASIGVVGPLTAAGPTGPRPCPDAPAPGPPRGSPGAADLRLDTLYALIRDHRNPNDRVVMTPEGAGRLWQFFSTRAGVVLDGGAKRVVFFAPSLVRVPVGLKAEQLELAPAEMP